MKSFRQTFHMSVKLCVYTTPARFIPLNCIYYLRSATSILPLKNRRTEKTRVVCTGMSLWNKLGRN